MILGKWPDPTEFISLFVTMGVLVISPSRLVGLVNKRFLTRSLTWLVVGTPKAAAGDQEVQDGRALVSDSEAQRSVPGRREQDAVSSPEPT